MTTCLTTFRTGLPGDSSMWWTLYQFFRTKKHVLDAISRKKLYPFAWGGRGRTFKSCHSDQIKPMGKSPSALFFLGGAQHGCDPGGHVQATQGVCGLRFVTSEKLRCYRRFGGSGLFFCFLFFSKNVLTAVGKYDIILSDSEGVT